MKKLLAPLMLLALVAALLQGCSSTSVSVGLKLELVALARSADGSVQVTWKVVNPNIVSYLVAQSTHRISLNGTLLGTIEDRDAVGIPAQQSVERTGTLKSPGGAANQAISDAIKAGSASYKMESAVTFRLYGESIEKSNLTSAGTVPVTTK